ncbi:hypothetical protein HYH03_004976 [Edaphochlamys debaryana]|uniref:Uncharacterized protein n=1 Tax=Edaphochlamys debaryana TaxID=47281 RepID=A0A835YDU0_9CHLO|nr:hypothetical protein HYH03_004976 [Edaphochlamys debaryana]|eukprot:KAG2496970.1 hypothetical protein HYH03_004976 [Edaphochlamys debaryana]
MVFQELPDYLRDNEFIKAHYRVPGQPFKQTFWSLFGIHNETGNVWTHLLGFVFFLCLTLYVVKLPPVPLALGRSQIDQLWESAQHRVHGLSHKLHELQEHLPHIPGLQELQDTLHNRVDSLVHNVDTLVHDVQEEMQHAAKWTSDRVHSLGDSVHHATERLNSLLYEALSEVLVWPVPRWPVYVFLAGAMTCLLLSATCHLFGCCSKHIAAIIWRFDYAGIAILIVASFYPPVYYGFLCQPYWRVFYLITTTIMGAGAVAVSLLDVFQTTQWRAFRAGMFAALGLWGAVPLIHACAVHRDISAMRTSTALDALMGALYLLGAVIYATRVPERWLPGRFDVLFHGHQIFHILIVAAAFVHYKAILLLLHWRDASGGCAAPGLGSRAVSEGIERALLHGLDGEGTCGNDPLAIDQVWAQLRQYAVDYLGNAAGAPARALESSGGGRGAFGALGARWMGSRGIRAAVAAVRCGDGAAVPMHAFGGEATPAGGRGGPRPNWAACHVTFEAPPGAPGLGRTDLARATGMGA